MICLVDVISVLQSMRAVLDGRDAPVLDGRDHLGVFCAVAAEPRGKC